MHVSRVENPRSANAAKGGKYDDDREFCVVAMKNIHDNFFLILRILWNILFQNLQVDPDVLNFANVFMVLDLRLMKIGCRETINFF